MPKTKLAVIILNYNGIGIIEEAIESLQIQTYKNFNLYVADDSSTDNSVNYIKKKYSSIKLIPSNKNLGPAGISNYAVSKTLEPYVVLVSNDMRFDKNCLKELVRGIEHDPHIGICTSVLVKHPDNTKGSSHPIDNAGINVDIFGFIKPNKNNFSYKKYKDNPIESVFASCGGSFIISRKDFNKLGGFDESFWGLSEDIDLSWRLRIFGKKVIVAPKSYLYHHISPTLGKMKQNKTRFLSERNNLTMILKNYQLTTLLFVLPIYFMLESVEIMIFIIMGRFDMANSIIKALIYNFVNIRRTLVSRQYIQKNRKISDKQILRLLFKGSYKANPAISVLKAKYKELASINL